MVFVMQLFVSQLAEADQQSASLQLYREAAAGNVNGILRCMASGFADVNWVNAAEQRRTAVHIACAAGHAAALECLLLNGGDMLLKDEQELAPLDYANGSGSGSNSSGAGEGAEHPDCVAVLIAHTS